MAVSTIWLERFVLGGVCVAAFFSLILLNVLKFDWTQRITLGGTILLFSYFVGHTIEKQRNSASFPASLSPSPTELPKSVPEKPPPVADRAPKVKPHKSAPPAEPQGQPALHPLTSLSDGQRFVLKQKLGAYAGSSVRLVLVGSDPQAGIVFEQLIDVFKDAGWEIQTARIGMVSIVGANYPSVPYLTSANIASPIVRNVFSIFAGVGIDLPLTPDAFMGPSMGTTADVVIVIR